MNEHILDILPPFIQLFGSLYSVSPVYMVWLSIHFRLSTRNNHLSQQPPKRKISNSQFHDENRRSLAALPTSPPQSVQISPKHSESHVSTPSVAKRPIKCPVVSPTPNAMNRKGCATRHSMCLHSM